MLPSQSACTLALAGGQLDALTNARFGRNHSQPTSQSSAWTYDLVRGAM
jgi:hypothetical protein